MPHRLRLYGKIVSQAMRGFIDDRGPNMGAPLAYYTLCPLAPLILIVIAVVGAALGHTSAALGTSAG